MFDQKPKATTCNHKVKLAIATFVSVIAASSFAVELAPPTYQVIDHNGVNVATGQVSVSLDDLSIGDGHLQLSHSIATHGSDFVNFQDVSSGYQEKFRGGLYKAVYHKNNSQFPQNWTYVARAFDSDSTIDFFINANGSYSPVKEQRASLVFQQGKGFVVTKADGTEVIFPSASSGLNETGYGMSQITYPNGFSIKVYKDKINTSGTVDIYSISSPIKSVITNNGLQLKYFYNIRTRPLDPSKAGATNNSGMEDNGLNWSANMPDYIKAINNKVEYCPPLATTCNLSQEWPTVTYGWPNGMPRAMYIGDSVFSVTDAMGGVTEYHHKAIDVSNLEANNMDHVVDGAYFYPRLVAVKPANSTTTTVNYYYRNVNLPVGSLVAWFPGVTGFLVGATTNGIKTDYAVGPLALSASYNSKDFLHQSHGGHKPVQEVEFNDQYQQVVSVDTWDQKITLEKSYLNRISEVEKKIGGNLVLFKYDSRGNLTERAEGSVVLKASYPSLCSNRKTCNQADWTSDGKGNKTFYSYHPQSGQVASETSPAVNGKSTKNIYVYSQKYAKYKQGGSSLVNAPTPIWMLTSQKYCINSNYNSYGCNDNDEVITAHEYDDNLFLIGTTVTADGKTLRTCYTNDIYGNRIGTTSAKANLTTCQP